MPEVDSENLVVRLLAWPRWDDPANLELLMEMSAPILDYEGVGLLLVLDPIRDPPEDVAVGALQAAFDRRYPSQVSLDVSIESRALDHDGRARLGRITGALVLLGKEPPGFNESTQLPMLANVFGVRKGLNAAAFKLRQSPPVSASSQNPDAPAPDISVVLVVQHDLPRVLQLLDALEAQDLAADRFEVLVVDDGCEEPVALDLTSYSYALTLIRQDGVGMGLAINAALPRTRGTTLVLYDEHSLPAPDSLRRHLDAQLRSANPVGVVGNFGIRSDFVRDSFAATLNAQAIMYPQPGMRAGEVYQGRALCAENLSIPMESVRSVGGFEEFCSDVGADWELGMRVDRACGLKVIFDPQNRCERNSELDLDLFLQRQYANGRSTAYTSVKHRDPSIIMGPDADVPSDDFWEALERQVERTQAEWNRLVERLGSTIAAEREAGQGPQRPMDCEPLIRRLGYLAFSKGLVEAHRAMTQSTDEE